jgi:hypothetical protein
MSRLLLFDGVSAFYRVDINHQSKRSMGTIVTDMITVIAIILLAHTFFHIVISILWFISSLTSAAQPGLVLCGSKLLKVSLLTMDLRQDVNCSEENFNLSCTHLRMSLSA